MGRILHKCDKTGVEWTVRKLVENYNNKIISYENAVQRGFVWRQDRKSEFILSVVLEKPIPPLYVTKDVEGNYSAIDGKQRSYTLIKFMNDEFELSGLRQSIEIEEDDGTITDYDLNGKTFSELREEVQNAIKDSTLHLEVLNNYTNIKEDEEYFYPVDESKIKFRMAKPGKTREIKYISPKELAAGMEEIIRQNVIISKDELYKTIAGLCGIQRVGIKVRELLDEAFSVLAGIVNYDGARISLKTGRE